ncbi:hypothetical protein P1X14_01750 [Sphingomonas sp. AOB5]|uniref:hypothetical protein n=1 Tax=Sphingomonas sp. AOB5 TaxID=3034017 RepID=UPI0023F792EB|nr:hypothetical protein [Sphingomonas sp. AOB5]MDF7773956.1 hypothetical protein [Sphingomonas sp. AOB5]
MPAAAGDRPGFTPRPDALSLLMQDDGVTHGGRITTIRLPTPTDFGLGVRLAPVTIQSDDLVTFEALDLTPMGYLPVTNGWEGRLASRFLFDGTRTAGEGWQLPAPQTRGEARLDPRNALNEGRASLPRGGRRRTPLSASLEFRLDGRPDSPAFSLGGGAATVLNVVRPQR